MMNWGCAAMIDRRTDPRIPFAGEVAYRIAPGRAGVAMWQDISSAGAGIKLDQHIRSGQHIMLVFEPPYSGGRTIELKGQVAWSRRADNPPTVAAGLRIFHDDPDATLAFSGLVEHAIALDSRLFQ